MDSFTEYFKEAEELKKNINDLHTDEIENEEEYKPKKKERKLRYNEIFDTKKKKK